MKARKTLTLLLLAALTLAACKYDDSELWEQVNQNTEELAAQAARIAALEAWQAETNTNIQALQTLLSTTDYITAVTPVVKDGVEVGFTISFLNTPAITDGNPIRANGTQGEQGDQGPAGDDAPLPQLATGKKLNEQQITTDSQNKDIEPDAIYLSVDGGQTWTRVSGEKGEQGNTGATGEKGDSFFESVDTTDPNCVTFTLANEGGSFSVPRYVGISLTFSISDLFLPHNTLAKIQCTVTGIDKPTKDNLYLITAPDGWKVVINDDLSINVTAPDADSEGEILVMLDNKKGSTTIGRITVFCGTELTIGNLQPGQLATLIGSRIDLKSITVTSGEINDDDWEAIKRNKDMLTDLDLAGTTYTGDDAAKFAYTGHMGDNSTLQTIKLPQGITYIGYFAFNHCSSLTSIDFPVALNTIDNYAFFGCSLLKSIEIPSGVTGIGAGAFGDCSSLSTATFLGETPPVHIGHVFYQCTALSDIYVPAGSVDAYKETWFEYADKIKAIEP